MLDLFVFWHPSASSLVVSAAMAVILSDHSMGSDSGSDSDDDYADIVADEFQAREGSIISREHRSGHKRKRN